jgi:hypothetical protein
MQDWTECPEAAGPQTEGVLYGANYGDPGMPTIGAIPPRQPREVRERERAAAAEAYERRLRVERAAIAISVSAMEGRALADDVLKEAALAAAKAVTT